MLEWTTKQPTNPGLYRVFHADIEHKFKVGGDWASWEELVLEDGRLDILVTDYQEALDEYLETSKRDGYLLWWYGPYPEPPPPHIERRL